MTKFNVHEIVTTIMFFLGAWLFTSVNELPEKYVLKSDYIVQNQQVNETLKEIRLDIKTLLKERLKK